MVGIIRRWKYSSKSFRSRLIGIGDPEASFGHITKSIAMAKRHPPSRCGKGKQGRQFFCQKLGIFLNPIASPAGSYIEKQGMEAVSLKGKPASNGKSIKINR